VPAQPTADAEIAFGRGYDVLVGEGDAMFVMFHQGGGRARVYLVHPGDDTWTDTPFVDGVVLIGDAAGYNDPIIGEGLSIALRDAKIVRDLVLDGARDAPRSSHTASSGQPA
jgi:flavin-dependent dehydrogenase